MALLKYVGNSPYGISLVLHDKRTKVTVSEKLPYTIKTELNESDRKYYESICKTCDIVLETEGVLSNSVEKVEVTVKPPVDEIVVTDASEVLEGTVQEESQVTKESIYESIKDTISSEMVDELADKLGVKSKKRQKNAKLWDIIEATDIEQLLELLGGN